MSKPKEDPRAVAIRIDFYIAILLAGATSFVFFRALFTFIAERAGQ